MHSTQTHTLLSNTLLIITSTLFLPAFLIALLYNYAALALLPQNTLRRQIRRSPRFRTQTFVIVGASTPAGLRTARAFYQTGHKVVGVDATKFGPSRFSRAISRVYVVHFPQGDATSSYISGLLDVILKEKATVLIDCTEVTSSVAQAQAKAVIERKTSCVCLSVDIELASRLSTRPAFLEFAKELDLSTVETHRVQSRNQIHDILNGSNGKKFILSTTNGSPNGSPSPPKRAVLPQRTLSATYNEVSQLKITSGEPWTLEQHEEGEPKYTATSLIVQGEIKALAVCYKLDSHGGVGVVPTVSSLHHAVQRYLGDVLERMEVTFSSHLCLDFYVAEKLTKSGVSQQILPRDGRFNASPALVLWTGTKGSIALTRAYMSLLASTANGIGSYTGLPYEENHSEIALPSESEMGVYFLGEDIRALMDSFLRLLTRTASFRAYCKTIVTTLGHVVSYREALYDFWDPLPAFWFYCVYAPISLCARKEDLYSRTLGEPRLLEPSAM